MEELLVDKPKKLELKKHVNAIHSSNNISLVQRKLFNALLFNAYNDLKKKKKFQISTKELCSLIGYSSRDYKTLKRSLLGLITTAIEWNVINISGHKDFSKWNASAIISSASIQNGVCEYEFSDLIKELLYYPEIYGRLNMQVQSKFKSTYGLALYENCIRYQGLKYTPWFDMENFRKLMGVPATKYKAYNDFKKRIIRIALKEVNELSPLEVCLEEKRVSRLVHKIRFSLGYKEEKVTNEPINECLSDELIGKIGLSASVINGIFDQYDLEYIKEKLHITISSNAYRGGKIRDLSGYFINALRDDYQSPKSNKEIIKKENKLKKIADKKAESLEVKKKNAYEKYLMTVTESYLNNLSEDKMKIHIQLFKEYLNNNNQMAVKWLRKDGIEDARVKSVFYHYIRQEHVNKQQAILNKETFESLIT